MSSFWKRMRTEWKLKSAIKKTVEEEEPGHLSLFLMQNKGCLPRVAEDALGKAPYTPWASLWLCLSLIRLNDDSVAEILDEILESEFAGWHRIDRERVQEILGFLHERGEFELFLSLAEKFDARDLVVSVERMTDEQFSEWLENRSNDEKSLDVVRRSLIAFLEKTTFNGLFEPGCEKAVARVYHAALYLWDCDGKEASLEILRILSGLAPNLIEQRTLEAVAAYLSSIVSKPGFKFVVEGDPQLSEMISRRLDDGGHMRKISPATAHCADILRAHPSAAWINGLKTTWIEISEYIRRTFRETDSGPMPPALEMAGSAVVFALGACAARSREDFDAEPKEEIVESLKEELEEKEKKRNELAGFLNDLIDRYNGRRGGQVGEDSGIEGKILDLRMQIREYDEKIDRQHGEIRQKSTTAWHLLSVLGNRQDYPDSIRQAAAWGLYRMLEAAGAAAPSGRKIREALRLAIYDGNWDDEKLKKGVEKALALEIDDEVLDIAGEYILNPCRIDLQGISSGKNFGEILESWLDDHFSTVGRAFAEHPVHVFPCASFAEIALNFLDGLSWMADMVDKHRDPGLGRRMAGQIGCIAALIKEHLPKASRFLSLYPIRLMELDHHQRILGKYSCRKCDLVFWTRYAPPKWKPGMLPGEAGEVKRRYLALEDRSTPNAIGIYYRLFEHPVLALPVIYHEFLHYGGVGGDVRDAIENESEVWMREILFMQFLIARMAPEKESEIPAYEMGIADVVKKLKLDGIGIQTQYDMSDPSILPSFCDMIERVYGRRKSEEEALPEVEEHIETLNESIGEENRNSVTKKNWHPEIEWPSLNSETTTGLTEKYRSILMKSKTVCHRMDQEQYMALIGETDSRFFLAEWGKYKSRESSMKIFDRYWGSSSRISPETIVAVVDRFGVTEKQAIEALNHIFRNLTAAGSGAESNTL